MPEKTKELHGMLVKWRKAIGVPMPTLKKGFQNGTLRNAVRLNLEPAFGPARSKREVNGMAWRMGCSNAGEMAQC